MATLRVLNLNVWDLPYSKDLSTRIRVLCRILALNDRDPVAVGAISDAEARAFASHSPQSMPAPSENVSLTSPPPPFFRGYDIIGLEEAFLEPHREALTLAARAGGLNYAHFFESGMGFPGYPTAGSPSGLLVLSRYPIIQVAFHRYSINGKPQRLLHWDWHVGKGVGLARVSSPMGLIDVYISHFVASYAVTKGERDEYLSDRVAQAYECAEFIQLSRRAPLAVLFCDLNSTSETLPVKIIKRLAGLRDSYRDSNPLPSHLRRRTTPEEEDSSGLTYSEWEALGHTCNTNVYADGHSRRVDYVLYSCAAPAALPDNLAGAAKALAVPAAPGGATAAALRRSGVSVTGKPKHAEGDVSGERVRVGHANAALAQRLGMSAAAAKLLDVALANSPTDESSSSSSSSSSSVPIGSLALALHDGSVISPFSPLLPTNHTPLVTASSSSSSSADQLPSSLVSPTAFALASQPRRGPYTSVSSSLPVSSSGSRPNPFSLQWQPVISRVVLKDPITPDSFPLAVEPAYLRYLRGDSAGASHSAEAGRSAEAGGDGCFVSDHCGISTTFVFPLPLPDGLSSPYIDQLCLERTGHSASHPIPSPSSPQTSAATAGAAVENDPQQPPLDGALPLTRQPLPLTRPPLTRRRSTLPRTAHSRRWSVVPRPLDLDLNPLQDRTLRRALRAVEAGMVDAQLRQKSSRRRHVLELGLIVGMILLGYWGVIGVGAVVLLLPPLVVAATAEFYLHTMFGNEEQSSLSSVWHSMGLRLQLGPAVSLCNVRTLAAAAAAAAAAADSNGDASLAGYISDDDFDSESESDYFDDDDDGDADNDAGGDDHDDETVGVSDGPRGTYTSSKGAEVLRRRRGSSSGSESHRHASHHHHHSSQNGNDAAAGFFTRLINIGKMFMGSGHFGGQQQQQQPQQSSKPATTA